MDSFFGIGLFELIMIAVVALLVLGPERLPGAMREVAKWMRQLRNLSNEFQSQFSEEFKMLDELNPRRIINEVIDPNATPTSASRPAAGQAAKPLAAKPVTPPATAGPAKPQVKPAAKPLGPAADSPGAANGEPQNSILPPAALGSISVAAGAAEAPATEQASGAQDAPSAPPPEALDGALPARNTVADEPGTAQ
jgi:sec-independent protein translocase protein TatB